MSEKPRKLRVFLCHTSADKPKVLELYLRLTMEDWIDPWLDVEKLLPGQHWTSVIKQSLFEADSVIILISNNSIKREGFAQREMNYAWDMSLEKPRSVIYLIPLRLEDCEIPFDLKERQWADYFGKKQEETYLTLLMSLKLRYKQKFGIEAEEFYRAEKQQQVAAVTTIEKAGQETPEIALLKIKEQIRHRSTKENTVRERSEDKKFIQTIEKHTAQTDSIKGLWGFIVSVLLVLVIGFIYWNWHTQSLSSPPAKTPTLISTDLLVFQFTSTENPLDISEESAKQTSTAKATLVLPSNTPSPKPSEKINFTPVPTGFRPKSYTLQYGEYTYCIARRFNVDPDALLSASGLTSPDLYYPGLVLKIPQSGAFPGTRMLASHPATYIVGSSDETLFSIACKYGDVEPGALASANGLATGEMLSVGQHIKIP